jgi:hypothetical protein
VAVDTPVATLIGDLIDSRRFEDRRGLQLSLKAAIQTVNAEMRPAQPLELTVGDEFQGGFSTLAGGARASLLLRLQLLSGPNGVDSRYGLGLGTITIFDGARSPVSQDGPGWWTARMAIDRAKSLSESPRTSFVRTCVPYGPEVTVASVELAAMEAFLFCRDSAIDQMTDRSRRLLLGLLRGHPQGELAAREGITQGAVSQNLRRSGASAIEAAQRRLEEAPG